MASELRQRRGGAVDGAHDEGEVQADLAKAKEEAARARQEAEELKRQLAAMKAAAAGEAPAEAVDPQALPPDAAAGTAPVSGGAVGSHSGEGQGAKLPKEEQDQLMADLQEMLVKLKQGPKPGLSNAAKKAKDELQVDPYSMSAIYDLGVAYAGDGKWNECMNVLLRGWKRVQEITNPDVRLDFLVLLSQASFQGGMYKQALAVLNDMGEVPPDSPDWTRYQTLKTQVHARNGDQQKSFKAFHAAVDRLDFDQAIIVWSTCTASFKQAGLFEATKLAMLEKARSDEARTKLEAIEKLSHVKDSITNPDRGLSALKVLVGTLLFFLVIVGLIWLEHKSFSQKRR